MLDEGKQILVGHHNIVPRGEGFKKQALSNIEFVELIVTVGPASATDPGKSSNLSHNHLPCILATFKVS